MLQIIWFEQNSDVQFGTTVFICQLSNVFALRGGKKRLKEGSSILSRFHSSNFLSFRGSCFFFVNFCLQ